ncbi:hypothetical protein [Paenibacillus tepidiphilus]|uniref:hypothetical protein n=1 Tax=Paenibacillus tepidiphilus TaxID=2608683 RepID=UPI00123C1F78|nr:hypothetical protein [Paenibacillus tepidiphilus]
MWHARCKKTIYLMLLLIILGGLYSLLFGLPWKSVACRKEFEVYLEEKYDIDFKVGKVDFDLMHRTYNAYASPVGDPGLRFFVGQNIENRQIYDFYRYEMERRAAGRK